MTPKFLDVVLFLGGDRKDTPHQVTIRLEAISFIDWNERSLQLFPSGYFRFNEATANELQQATLDVNNAD